MIESMPISSRELVRRLRELVDYVADSDNRIVDPSMYAVQYSRLIHMAQANRAKLDTKYLRHNLTPRRTDYILRLLGEFEEER